MPLQLKHLGSDVVQHIFSYDDTYKKYYTSAVVPIIRDLVVAYCRGCECWVDGNYSDDDRSDNSDSSFLGTSPPSACNLRIPSRKHYTKEEIPTFYNIHLAYCSRCECWIYSRKF